MGFMNLDLHETGQAQYSSLGRMLNLPESKDDELFSAVAQTLSEVRV